MHALALAFSDETLHVADLPYRLSAPSFQAEPPQHVAVWDDGDGNLVGFGIVQYRMMLDLATDPRARDEGIEARILD